MNTFNRSLICTGEYTSLSSRTMSTPIKTRMKNTSRLPIPVINKAIITQMATIRLSFSESNISFHSLISNVNVVFLPFCVTPVIHTGVFAARVIPVNIALQIGQGICSHCFFSCSTPTSSSCQ